MRQQGVHNKVSTKTLQSLPQSFEMNGTQDSGHQDGDEAMRGGATQATAPREVQVHGGARLWSVVCAGCSMTLTFCKGQVLHLWYLW